MNPRLHSVIALLVLLGALAAGQENAVGVESSSPHELHTTAEVRRLTPEQAATRIPVRLKGVVTFFSAENLNARIQDDTGGIYLGRGGFTNLVPGQMVEVEGVSRPGNYAPVVIPGKVKIIGAGKIPPAKAVSAEQLVSGREDSQFVEVEGGVRAVSFDESTKSFVIDVVTEGERFVTYAKQLPVEQAQSLVDSTVKVRGVCATLYNSKRQLFGVKLMVPRAEDLLIEKPAPAKPAEIPIQTIRSLLQFAPQGTVGHRVKVAGTVIYQEPGKAVFIEDQKEGLFCETLQQNQLRPGDQVEIVGFPAKGEYTPVLGDAVYRKIGAGAEPKPDVVNLGETLSGAHDCRLIEIKARVLERAQFGPERFLVLETGGFVFHAYQPQNTTEFVQLQVGSEVALTGICRIERANNWEPDKGWAVKSFSLLLRSPSDITLLRSPPWWTLKRVLAMTAGLAILALLAVFWVAILRRKVRQQTEIIQKRLQIEAALKDRYENLFENANDMMFTHDQAGRILSINRAGEHLLEHPRNALLSRNLVELIAENQQPAARQWLEQIGAGAELPATDWDFIRASGHPIKLEISSRFVQEGSSLEVEGVARDVTERRRLERELLKISNREQRRIGHDLHDGVCQQLAAIAYLVDLLADRLQEKKQPEFAEAERIGTLMHEVSVQARSVARGLFPAQLDEHGLIVALEDLADNASIRYQINCHFACQIGPLNLDREMELHLYYIVQEALLNGVNHGKATLVTVTLTAEGKRLRLTVEDNGTGFQLFDKERSGMGIRIMKYRAKAIGATLDLQSHTKGGTRVECLFNPSSREDLKATNYG